jgi:hypothetical protein
MFIERPKILIEESNGKIEILTWTHHVRRIKPDVTSADYVLVAIEARALASSAYNVRFYRSANCS